MGLARTVFLTEEYPPLNTGANGTIEGIGPEMLREAAGQLNLTLRADQLRLTTWTDAYRTALERNDTVVFSTARTPDREDLFQWAGPIARLQYVVLADRNRTVAGDDLARYRIATVRDDTAATYLREAGVPDSSNPLRDRSGRSHRRGQGREGGRAGLPPSPGPCAALPVRC